MPQILPLHLLRAGEIGHVVDIHGPQSSIVQLEERGLRKGSTLEAICPGNPFLLRVDETKLSFRSDGQIEVLVEVP